MNDDATFAAVKDRLTEARDSLGIPPRPPVTAVFARARRRRIGRRVATAGLAVTGAGLVTAAALHIPGQQAPVPQASGPPQASAGTGVHVRLAASWSVDTNADGTVRFRLRDTSDPSRLQKALRQAGVPAVVRFGEICLAAGKHRPPAGAMAGPGTHTGPKMQSVIDGSATGGGKLMSVTWTISPANIPHGTRFVVSAVRPGAAPPGHVGAAWEFVPAGAPLGCTAIPPALGGG